MILPAGYVRVEWLLGPHDGCVQGVPADAILREWRRCYCHGAAYLAERLDDGSWLLHYHGGVGLPRSASETVAA